MGESCERIRDMLIDAMSDETSTAVRSEIDEHLAGCGDCRAFADALMSDDRRMADYVDSAEEFIARIGPRVDRALDNPPREDVVVPISPISKRRSIMDNRAIKVVVAAVTAAAAILAIGLVTDRFGGGEPAYADVMDEIKKAKSVTYREVFTYEDHEPRVFRVAATDDGRMRTEYDHGGVRINDFNGGTTATIMPDIKKVIVVEESGRVKSDRPFSYITWMQTMHRYTGVFVGKEEFEGEAANVFEVKRDEFTSVKIWAAVDNDLPLRIETVNLPNPDEQIVVPMVILKLRDFGADSDEASAISYSGTGTGIQKKTTSVRDGFSWNEAFDESLFEIEAPEDWDVVRRTYDDGDSDEAALTKAFKSWIELTGGGFPENINDLGKQELIEPLLVGKFNKDGDPDEELKEALTFGHVLLQGLYFVQTLKVEGNWGYAGDDVEPGDAGAPLCWWKKENSEHYRVVYGDLSVGDLTLVELQKRTGSK